MCACNHCVCCCRSSHARLLYDAEGKAREARKRVWEKFQEEPVSNEAEEDVPQSQQEEEPERNISYQKVMYMLLLLLLLFLFS